MADPFRFCCSFVLLLELSLSFGTLTVAVFSFFSSTGSYAFAALLALLSDAATGSVAGLLEIDWAPKTD